MKHFAPPTGLTTIPLALLLAASASWAATQTQTQTQAQTPPPVAGAAGQTSAVVTPTANETIVSRIALYPDDLVAVILPASTYPLQIVEAARYLDKRAKDPKLPVQDDWDASVKTLLNYPTVVTAMNTDLDWLQSLGDAVTSDQAAVLAAVQSYRRKVYTAGNLKSDDKQLVAMEQDIITIAPANPQVIYVPQYNPTTVMYYGGYSSWGYYGYGYPSYYYPYAPGAALAAGLIWGAAIGAAWNGGRYAMHYGGYGGYGGGSIRINNGDINVGSGNRVNGGAGAANRATAGGTAWKPSSQQRGTTGRVGDPARGGASAGQYGPGASAGNRGGASAGQYGPAASGGNRGGASAGQYGPPSSAAGNRGSYDSSASNRASSGSYGGNRASAGQYGSRSSYGGASSFGGYGSGHSASMASSRGSMSRGGGRRR